MTDEQAEETVRDRLLDYVRGHLTPKKEAGKWCCPFCLSEGGDNRGNLCVDPHTNNKTWHCFTCDRGGSIFDLYQKLNGCEFREAKLALFKEYGLQVEAYKPAGGYHMDTAGQAPTAAAAREAEEQMRYEGSAKREFFEEVKKEKAEIISETAGIPVEASGLDVVLQNKAFSKANEVLFVVPDGTLYEGQDLARVMCDKGAMTVHESEVEKILKSPRFKASIAFFRNDESKPDDELYEAMENYWRDMVAKRGVVAFNSHLRDLYENLDLSISNTRAFFADERIKQSAKTGKASTLREAIKEFGKIEYFTGATFGSRARFAPCAVSVIVARSGRGKSMALNSLAIEALQQNEDREEADKKRIIYFTLEEPMKDVYVHLICRRYAQEVINTLGGDIEAAIDKLKKTTQTPFGDVCKVLSGRAEEIPQEIREGFEKAANYIDARLNSKDLMLVSHNTIPEIDWILESKAKAGDIVLLDYLQIVQLSEKETPKDKFMRVETVAHQITDIAKKSGVILVAAAQANRGQSEKVEAGTRFRRDILNEQNIRDSDVIFQDANIAINIGKEWEQIDTDSDDEDVDNEKATEPDRRFCVQHKNRLAECDSTEREMVFNCGYALLAVKTKRNGKPKAFKYRPFKGGDDTGEKAAKKGEGTATKKTSERKAEINEYFKTYFSARG